MRFRTYAHAALLAVRIIQNRQRRQQNHHSLTIYSPRRPQFSLSNLSNHDHHAKFRFSHSELDRITPLLLDQPFIKLRTRHKIPRTEALCILLRRLAYPNRLSDLQELFPRPISVLSEIIGIVLHTIHDKYCHLLLLNPASYDVEDLQILSDAVAAKDGVVLTTCFGFIDGTVRLYETAICRPTVNQEIAYNGHKQYHALKYHGIVAPNGLFLEMYGPRAGVDHDARLLRDSNLIQRLSELPKPLNDDMEFVLYGDPAYPPSPGLVAPFKGAVLEDWQMQFNSSMSSVRESVEWGFKEVINTWAFVDFKKNQKVHLQPVGKMYLVATLLCNIRNCLHPNQISLKFDLQPPELEDYLNGYFV